MALQETNRPSGSEVPRLMDVEGVAIYMHTSVRHVRRLVQDRRVPFLKVGGLLRFRRDDIDGWLDEHSVQPER